MKIKDIIKEKSKYTKKFQKYMKNINMHAMMQNYEIKIKVI